MKIIISWKDPEYISRISDDIEDTCTTQDEKECIWNSIINFLPFGEQIDIEFDTETHKYNIVH